MKKENNAQLIKILDNILMSFMVNVSFDNYFTFTSSKKLTTQYLLLKHIIKFVLNQKTKYDQNFLKTMLDKIEKRSEETEVYELTQISRDVKLNFDLLYDMLIEQEKPKRTIKTNKTTES